jgi:hypothetical protein
MNYKKNYDNLIKKCKSENRIKKTYYQRKKDNFSSIYYENHHIVPKCLNGTNNKENLVLLTAREHYIAHKLLTFIYPDNRKLACAFFRMAHGKNKEIVSLSDYEYAKKLKSRIPISEETKLKMKNALNGRYVNKTWEERYGKEIASRMKKFMKERTGEKHPCTGTHRTIETKKKMVKSSEGKKKSKTHCENISKSCKGKTWVERYGKEIANQMIEKRKKNEKPCEYCKKLISPNVFERHMKKCKETKIQ